MIIATFNVNSIRARLANLLTWLEAAKPDAVILQEIKCEAQDFPALELKAAGYEALIKGQKAYHGVAILTRIPTTIVKDTLDAGEARYLEADWQGLRLINIYAPNGNPMGSEKFPYKLGWLAKLETRLKELLSQEVPFLVGGDFNIIPEDIDCYSPSAWANDALFQPESRTAYRRLLNLGLYDAYRALHPTTQEYTFWDYQAGAWPQNHGIRIDHFLLSPLLADRLLQCNIDKAPRSAEKASDHTPVILTLS
jgi:exodeoxyribonuclease-3